MYGCENLYVTFREENRLRVLENKVRRKECVSKRDEVTGDWRRLHNENLHDLHKSPEISGAIK